MTPTINNADRQHRTITKTETAEQLRRIHGRED
nr:MAG TPA: hypothetical protein [Caudoviricetes sp.]